VSKRPNDLSLANAGFGLSAQRDARLVDQSWREQGRHVALHIAMVYLHTALALSMAASSATGASNPSSMLVISHPYGRLIPMAMNGWIGRLSRVATRLQLEIH
jgi:hypothetical protein